MNIGSLIPSLIGMGTTIGAAIPGLKKPKKTDSSAAAVRKAQSQVAGAATGAAQTGHGASRGLNIRAGLRSASELVGAAAAKGAEAADMDEQRYQTQLDARNERLAKFGAGIGEGAAQMTQALIGDDAGGEADTKARGMESGQGTAFKQAEQTLSTDVRGEDTGAIASMDDPEVAMLQQELATLRRNEELASSDDPRLSGPHAQFNTKQRLEQLRAKSPTVAAPEIEEALDHRLRAKALMLQDAERYGMHMDTVLPMINRQLGLKPGQSVQNPYGVRFDMGEGEE
jgi:hypothetical protein